MKPPSDIRERFFINSYSLILCLPCYYYIFIISKLMQTILGANGIIGEELAKELKLNYTTDIRIVGRNPKKINNTDSLHPADLLDLNQTLKAVQASEICYLTVGLPYTSEVWFSQWEIIMKNAIESCVKTKSKLVYFDNTYMHGQSDQLVTEEEPFTATGRKGLGKAKATTLLLDAIKDGKIEAAICRAPEFYGPGKTKSITNSVFFQSIKKGKKPRIFLTDNTLRTLIYAPDASRATALIGNTPDAYNQTWNLPCDDNRMTYKQWIKSAEFILNRPIPYTVLKKWQLKAASLTNNNIKETLELLPRYEVDNLFDSSKFKNRFPDFKVTSYREGISKILLEEGGPAVNLI